MSAKRIMLKEAQSRGEARALDIEVREVATIEEYDACVRLQREAFGLPELEISPRRHLLVSREAGGWTLGAFVGGKLVGFVLLLHAVPSDPSTRPSHIISVLAPYPNPL